MHANIARTTPKEGKMLPLLTPAQLALAKDLFDLGSIRFGEFKLKLHETNPSAPLSPIYLNLRTSDNPKPGPLTEETMRKIGEVLNSLVCLSGISDRAHILGIPNAGDPFAEALSQQQKRMLGHTSLLKMAKDDLGDGMRRIGDIYEGKYAPGDQVILVDDLVTKADTKLEAIEKAEDKGLVVIAVVVLVDREQGGVQELRRAGYRVLYAFGLSSLLEVYAKRGLISQDQADKVMEYVRSS